MTDSPRGLDLDLRKKTIDLIAERLGRQTLGSMRDYEATVLAILHYISEIFKRVAPSPERLIELYVDYKLSVDGRARRELVELFKSMVGAPVEQPQQPHQQEHKRLRWI